MTRQIVIGLRQDTARVDHERRQSAPVSPVPLARRDLISRLGSLAALAVFGGAAVVTTAIGRDSAPTRDPFFFRIGTGATGGAYFPVGGMLAQVISQPPGARGCERGGSCGVPGLIAVAQATRGSLDNLRLLASGALESGLVQTDLLRDAYAGDPAVGFSPQKGLRMIATLFPEALHVVVRRDSAFTSIADLKGQRVATGPGVPGAQADAMRVLAAAGLAADAFTSVAMGPQKAVQALRLGEIDGFCMFGGSPANVILALAEQSDIRLIGIPAAAIAELRTAYPYFRSHTIPAGHYRGVGAVETVAVDAVWVVTEALSDAHAYGITAALWHERARAILDAGHPQGRAITLDSALQDQPVPLHPGAERFYRERGLIR